MRGNMLPVYCECREEKPPRAYRDAFDAICCALPGTLRQSWTMNDSFWLSHLSASHCFSSFSWSAPPNPLCWTQTLTPTPLQITPLSEDLATVFTSTCWRPGSCQIRQIQKPARPMMTPSRYGAVRNLSVCIVQLFQQMPAADLLPKRHTVLTACILWTRDKNPVHILSKLKSSTRRQQHLQPFIVVLHENSAAEREREREKPSQQRPSQNFITLQLKCPSGSDSTNMHVCSFTACYSAKTVSMHCLLFLVFIFING